MEILLGHRKDMPLCVPNDTICPRCAHFLGPLRFAICPPALATTFYLCTSSEHATLHPLNGEKDPVKIATWNVNSIRMRIGTLVDWLNTADPDVVLLQELKVTQDHFPADALAQVGFNAAVAGQKTYNGVAILAKMPIRVEQTTLPGDTADPQARYIEAIVGDVRVASIYLPNGNPANSEKFTYKLAWMERLNAHARTLLEKEESVVLGGDYNICPTDEDLYDPQAFAGDALCRPESRGLFRSLCNLGMTDAIRVLNPQPYVYSYWDYQAGHWNRDEGLRIDHLLLSPQAADRLGASGIDKAPRGKNKPSDHTPVWCELNSDPPAAGKSAHTVVT